MSEEGVPQDKRGEIIKSIVSHLKELDVKLTEEGGLENSGDLINKLRELLASPEMMGTHLAFEAGSVLANIGTHSLDTLKSAVKTWIREREDETAE